MIIWHWSRKRRWISSSWKVTTLWTSLHAAYSKCIASIRMRTTLLVITWCVKVSTLFQNSLPLLLMLIICCVMLLSDVRCISDIRRRNSLSLKTSCICWKKTIPNWMHVLLTCFWFFRQNTVVVITRLLLSVSLLLPEQILTRPLPQVSVLWKARFTEVQIFRLLICSIICRRTSRTGQMLMRLTPTLLVCWIKRFIIRPDWFMVLVMPFTRFPTRVHFY